ncbi:MAG: HAMP domain-containing sensor histidine kinase [Oscillospiraceae bacterium]
MEIKNKKTVSIFKLFLNHIMGLCVAIILLIVAIIIAASVSLQTGIIFPANYTDIKLEQMEKALRENFDKNLLPPYCSYIVIDETIGITDRDMSKEDTEKTRIYLLNGTKSYSDAYKIITQINGNKIVIKYDILAHFANPILHKLIPYPEILVLLVLLGLIILFTVVTASKFSKKLKQNLIPIIVATEKIEAQDLDFEMEPSKITEFNSALEAIDKLKKELTISLNRQWNKELQQKAQLSALAHDIKTPLTVIRGNAELLAEEEYSRENKELLSYIKSNTNTIEKYLELLMNVVNDGALAFNRESINLKAFINEVIDTALPICKVKSINLDLKSTTKCDSLYIDSGLVKRAIINVIDNAVRYSVRGSSIDVIVRDSNTQVVFEISDCGTGFSGEGLKKATQEFFTEDASRTNKHYGLGLCFVKKVVEMHRGTLIIENISENQGAKVSIGFAKEA